MFIWDFVASTVMDDLIDWFYGQLVGFLGNFFAQMGNMGVELFDLEWVQAVILFFSKLAWALFAVSLVVRAFECDQGLLCRVPVHHGSRPAVRPVSIPPRNSFCRTDRFGHHHRRGRAADHYGPQ